MTPPGDWAMTAASVDCTTAASRDSSGTSTTSCVSVTIVPLCRPDAGDISAGRSCGVLWQDPTARLILVTQPEPGTPATKRRLRASIDPHRGPDRVRASRPDPVHGGVGDPDATV